MIDLVRAESAEFSLTIRGNKKELPRHIEPGQTAIYIQGFDSLAAPGYVATNPPKRAPDLDFLGEPLLFEESAYEIIVENRLGADAPSLKVAPIQNLQRRWEKGSAAFYAFRIGSHAGNITFTVSGGEKSAALRVEIFPSKIDYKVDYEALVDDLEFLARGLSFALMGQTSAGGAATGASTSAADWIARAERIAAEIYREITHISSHGAKAQILAQENLVSKRAALRLPPGRLRDKSLAKHHQGKQIVRVLKRLETFDTPVNRFVKHELGTIRQKVTEAISILKRRLASDRFPDKASIKSLLSSLETATRFLTSASLHEFVSSAGHLRASDRYAISSRLDNRYSRLLRNLSFFRRVASLHVNRKDVSAERISQLYEWWAFYKLASSLSKYLRPAARRLITSWLQQGEITLLGGEANAIDFVHEKTGNIARLVYQSRSVQSATVPQAPDTLLELSMIGGWYVFDAKYKIQYDSEYLSRYRLPGPKEEDINTAHRYRDAVLNNFRRVVAGSYIIFPFRPARRFATCKLFKSIRTVDVGAIPLLPGNDELLDYVVRRLLRRSLKGKPAA